jgi:hypothetical protein
MNPLNVKETRMNPLKHLRRNIVAYVALFAALSAGAYAAGLKKNSVGSKQIKTAAVKDAEIASGAVSAAKLAAGSVDGGKVADGSLKGADIDEGSLGEVPNAADATNADNATNATNATNAVNAEDADTVGGASVKTFSASQQPPNDDVEVVTIGDLTLTLGCTYASGVVVNATTAVDNASVQSIMLDQIGNAEAWVNQEDWDTGTTLAIVPGAADAGNLIGELRYRTADGKVVTVNFGSDATDNGCQLFGTAVGR